MTRTEAIQAMQAGNKITHVLFLDFEWMQLTDTGMYQFEDDVTCHVVEFWMDRKHDCWNEGWDIFEQPKSH